MKTIRLASFRPESVTDYDFNSLTLSRSRGVKKHIRKRANAAVNFLKQIKWLKPKPVEFESYRPITLSEDRIYDFLMSHSQELLCRYGFRDMTVIIGRKEFFRMADQELDSPFRFQFRVDTFSRQNRIAGMLLIALPWIEGVVCIPKEYLPIEERIKEVSIPETDDMRRNREMESEGNLAAALWNSTMGRNDNL